FRPYAPLPRRAHAARGLRGPFRRGGSPPAAPRAIEIRRLGQVCRRHPGYFRRAVAQEAAPQRHRDDGAIMHALITPERIWLAIGFAGQALFASRFIIQWFKSELEGRSVIPLAFWYCSMAGGIVLLAYAIYKRDPVF